MLETIYVQYTVPASRDEEFSKLPPCPAYGRCWLRTLTVDADCASAVCVQSRPEGDEQYCKRTQGRSPKETRWAFHDDTV